MQAEERVRSWAELQEALFAGAWDEQLRRFRSSVAFRGRGDADEPLLSSLQRLGGEYWTVEPHLLRNFRKYAGPDALPGDSAWAWLALAKHHGLPTRLLDWTLSPLVAMHFATADAVLTDRDGVIWCIDYADAHAGLPERLRRLLEDEGSDLFTAELLEEAVAGLQELDELDDDGFVLFLEPPALDQRIVNQYAVFSLLPDARSTIDELFHETGVLRRVLVPREIKGEVRDKLDQANVTERVLFPGLDGLAAWLERYYRPRS